MERWVEIEFDCLPLRSINRFDIPIDASPRYRKFLEDVFAALEKHGSLNSYYLYRATCTYRLLNDPTAGMIQFSFEGTLLTESDDRVGRHADLRVDLVRETCDWLTEPVVQWFAETVPRSVLTEFNRYIQAGDLAKTEERLAKLKEETDSSEGYLGMYL
jgi:hypothetical protein